MGWGVGMMDLTGRRVLIFQQRNWALRIGHAVAKRLQERGCRLAALTIQDKAHEFVLRQKEVSYDLVVFGDDIKFAPAEYLGDDDYSLADICDDLGVDTVWELVQSMRAHVKSYKDKYYYGFKQNMSDEDIIVYIKAVYKNIKSVFAEFKPEVIVTPNFVALQHLMFYLYARKHGVRMFGVTDMKVRGYFSFSDHLQTCGPFADRIAELDNGAHSDNRERAKAYIRKFREQFIKPDTVCKSPLDTVDWWGSIKQEILPYWFCLHWFLKKGWEKKNVFGVTLDTLSPRYILRDHYMRKLNKWRSNRFQYADFDSIEKFVFFPLQFQPEETIDVHSPRFNNQLETARQLAMSLPGDYTLVTKEHPMMIDKRSPSYLEKLARTPNVKLIDPKISSEYVLERAPLVISPGGTILAEAAILKIPAIQLGEVGRTKLLPNVCHYTDMSTVSAVIKKQLGDKLDSLEYEQRLINYFTAAYDVGFKADYVRIWELSKEDGLEHLATLFVDEVERTFVRA